MSLYDIIQNILDVSKNHNLVREVGEGDIYNYLNSSEHQYPCVFLTVSSINDDLNLRNVNCTLFYVDRLTSDESNKILVQSLGLSVLSDIVERIAGDVDTVEYTTFTEKFTDLCGGVYASLSIGYPLDGACSNDFEVRELEVTENGVYDVLGYDRIVVTTSPKFVVPDGMKFSQSKLSKFPESLDFSEITDVQGIFYGCENLTTIPQLDTSKSTNFNDMFSCCNNLISISQLDTSNGVSFYEMFFQCYNLAEIPQLDTSKGTDFNSMFYDCDALTTIPQLDTSKGTDFSYMFCSCRNLTTIPQLDTSKGTYFKSMFSGCRDLTTIPQLDTSNGTRFDNMFNSCNKLTEIPQLDTSNGTNFYSMFGSCSKLTTIPQLDTSNGTNFKGMFQSCDNLITVPQLDTSNGTSFSNMFSLCFNLTEVSQLDTSNGEDFDSMFNSCIKLTEIPQLDTSNGTSFGWMFYYCSNITKIPQLDTSNGASFNNMFGWCHNLKTIEGELDFSNSLIGFGDIFIECQNLENVQFTGSINYNISFSDCRSLTYESVKSILTACSNTTNIDSKTLTFNITLTDQNSELADLVATCNSKGWTISGLTIN